MSSLVPAILLLQSVMIAPHALLVSGGDQTATLDILSQDPASVEVVLSSFYALPVSDSAGHVVLETFEASSDSFPSAADWIQPYPRRFVLPPFGRQRVRLRVAAPPGTADGEYWGRVMVSVRPRDPPATTDIGGGISVGLSMEVRTVLPFFYRRGRLTTGVELDGVSTTIAADSLVLRPRLHRTQNAAFIGTLRAVLRDSAGRERGATAVPLAVYYSLSPRLTFPISGLPAGRYDARLEVVAEREDLPVGFVLPTHAVSGSATIELP